VCKAKALATLEAAQDEVTTSGSSGETAEKDPTVLGGAVMSHSARTAAGTVPEPSSVVDDVAEAAWRQR